MAEKSKKGADTPFPSIQPDMVSRLSDEAEMRTIQPQAVDWTEIHRLAAEARKKAS